MLLGLFACLLAVGLVGLVFILALAITLEGEEGGVSRRTGNGGFYILPIA